MRLHIEKRGSLTYCGRRVRNGYFRMTVQGTPISYWTACETMGRLGCYACSDRLWGKLGGGPLTNTDPGVVAQMLTEAKERSLRAPSPGDERK